MSASGWAKQTLAASAATATRSVHLADSIIMAAPFEKASVLRDPALYAFADFRLARRRFEGVLGNLNRCAALELQSQDVRLGQVQVIVGRLQRLMQLPLTDRDRQTLAQLPQKFRF